jgi:putative membrane protein
MWYNKNHEMEVCMNLSEIRAQARTIRNQTNGIFSLFAIPTLVTILSTYLSPNRHLEEIIPQLEINQAFVVIFGRQIFPQIVEFIIALLFLSASFSMIEVVRNKRDTVGFMDIGRIFSAELFSPIFITQLTKSILLLLWNSISLVGSFFLVFSSYKVLAIYGKISDWSQLTAASPEVEQIVSYAPMMFLGTLIVLAGTAVFLMANYAYSQTDFILYDQLSTGTYQGPWQVLVQSRRMMKGYKWKRFLLDLSFIGWYILIGITLGIAGIVAYPYITTARVLFYENLKTLSK